MEERLFNLLADILGRECDILDGELHIIDTTNYDFVDEIRDIRVYFLKDKIGYCFDVIKEVIDFDEDGEPNDFEYSYYNEWDGFDKIDAKKAFKIIKEFDEND